MGVKLELDEAELRAILYALEHTPKAPMGKALRALTQETYFKLAGKYLTRDEEKKP